MWSRSPGLEPDAVALAELLAPRQVTVVVGIERAGARLGRLVARKLGVRFAAIDIAYPASRPWLGRWGEALLFPVKELLYRCTEPRLRGPVPSFDAGERIALVDDMASSGRTLSQALLALCCSGVSKRQITVAVARCGAGAGSLVEVKLRS